MLCTHTFDPSTEGQMQADLSSRPACSTLLQISQAREWVSVPPEILATSFSLLTPHMFIDHIYMLLLSDHVTFVGSKVCPYYFQSQD